MLGREEIAGKSFLDIGSGSGLFSLAAMRLGAASVHSMDYDPQCFACTQELKRRYYPQGEHWQIEQGNVLDPAYMERLGEWDIVYSWGVLHHTGNLWRALEMVIPTVVRGGRLFISIYNDQGRTSRRWWQVKRAYNRLSPGLRFLILIPAFILLWGPTLLRDFLRLKPFATWKEHSRSRGMSAWRDVVDWVGGFPFEVAKPEDIINFYSRNGFKLEQLKTVGNGSGCNQFLFQRLSP
jgi:2-polyprenyl-6-hydroxyphenyl methylase/3-demethylubiquinone-9 3-methyltransferase